MNCKLLKETNKHDTDKIFCEWCNEESNSSRRYFHNHITKFHKRTVKEYYDSFCKNEGDGICRICGNETIYSNYGYYSFCSSACLIEFNKTLRVLPDNYGEIMKQRLSSVDHAVAITKRKETNLIKYGVEYVSQIEGCHEKARDTCMERYGEYKDFGNKKIHDVAMNVIKENYDSVNDKRKLFWTDETKKSTLETRRNTCLERYGVDSISKIEDMLAKVRKTREDAGDWIPSHLQKPYKAYRLQIKSLTLKQKQKLFDNWDGMCYYTGKKLLTPEMIKNIPNFVYYEHGDYPTIDHKISCHYGFLNNLPPEQIASYDNLCICSLFINCSKNFRTEDEFLEIYKHELL